MQDKDRGGLIRTEEAGEDLTRTEKIGEGHRRLEGDGGYQRVTEEA